MNATVITTGPGVIIATATASRNCCSVSQWKPLTTPPWRNGTMARPLPKTNAPASAKYQPRVHRVAAEAGPANPEIDQSERGSIPSAPLAFTHLGGAFAHMASTPLARNSQMISDSVQAVTIVLTENSAQSKRSRAKVIFTSL